MPRSSRLESTSALDSVSLSAAAQSLSVTPAFRHRNSKGILPSILRLPSLRRQQPAIWPSLGEASEGRPLLDDEGGGETAAMSTAGRPLTGEIAENGPEHEKRYGHENGQRNGQNGAEAFQVVMPDGSLKEELLDTVDPLKALLIVNDDPFESYRGKSFGQKAFTFLAYVFPILDWGLHYDLNNLFGDIVAGLTIASLAVPQDIGYAGLAFVPPINGLFSSFLPPLVYAVLGTSKHIAIGPTAVVSLLVGNLATEYVDPDTNPTTYLHFVFTVTFWSGIIQAGMGFLRLGFIIDFLSHAAIVGFMGGAAVTIALQQLKGLLGYTKFTNATDIVAVLSYVFHNTNQFNWHAFLIGISFLVYLIVLKVLAWYFKKTKPWGKVFFFWSALGPLTSVIIATLCVWATGAKNPPANVPCVKKMPKGFNNFSSMNELFLSGEYLADTVSVGVVVGLISLTEAIAIARTFAAMEGYHIDGNKEMIAYGAMNVVGSLTSAYATTGSFSRSAVNYNAGGHTMLTNIVMSFVVLITIVAITPVFEYLPSAAISAIIINAVITLIDLPAMWQIWKADKWDIVVVVGTFFGVLFVSVEIGLLIGVVISMVKVLVQVTRPHLAVLGEIPGSAVYRSVEQYRYAKETPGVLCIRVDAPVFFTNANFVREKVLILAEHYDAQHDDTLTHVILDFTPVPDIDTTGVHSLEELYRMLHKMNVQLGISNPSRIVLRKLQASGFIDEIGQEYLFLSVNEGAKTFKAMRDTSSKEV